MLTPGLRTLNFTAHVTSSVGWLGAVVAYLGLAAAALTSSDPDVARAGVISIHLIGWYVIVPFSLAALLTGLIQSLGTEWGLFRHYWVAAKVVLTVAGVTVLLIHMRTVSEVRATLAAASVETHRSQLIIHAAGGLGILLIATVLSIYKPWGKTAYGRRVSTRPDVPVTSKRAWTRWLLVGVVVAAVLFVAIMHLMGRGMRH